MLKLSHHANGMATLPTTAGFQKERGITKAAAWLPEWTICCAQVLHEFNLTLDTSEAISLSIGINYTNFTPGTSYCVSLVTGTATPITSNGLCIGGYCGTGEDYCKPGKFHKGICDGAPIPYSTNGFCGNGTNYCGTGCQSSACTASTTSSSAVTTLTQAPGSISKDGTCRYGGGLICKGSSFGDYCSAAGYCGEDILGCQSVYGSWKVTGYMP
ncbi:hypothetical protein GGR58DRAFT_511616 [Xylaria digitata]|nr:hypothetical protein GGR58DRAFT_511616 [Xylaria digitata]